MELGGDEPTSEVDVELEEVFPPESAFFSSPHGEETNEDGAIDPLMRRASRTASADSRVSFALSAASPRAPAEATPAAAEEPDVEAGREGALLADAAASPESLADALAELLGAEPALELVRGALDRLASLVPGPQLAALPAPTPGADGPPTRQPDAPKLIHTKRGESKQLIFARGKQLSQPPLDDDLLDAHAHE